MKVAHITTIDLSLRYLLLNQLRDLAAAGYEVVGISAPGPYVPELEAAGIRHISVPMTRQLTPVKDLAIVARLIRLFRQERFTIVHTHTPKPGLLGQLAARWAGVPVVLNTVHGFYFHEHMHPLWRRFYIQIEKIAATCSDTIFSQNREDMQTALAEGICRPEQLKWLGNGIDLRYFAREAVDKATLVQARAELKLDPARPVVGFVGRLVAEKGVRELLAAARLVLDQRPEVQFLFVGPFDAGKQDAVSPTIAADYGIAYACTFAGMRKDMPVMYALMDLFVLPSHREGFPRALMEASAMGLPCIATNIRGCREAVVPEQNGLLVPLRDIDALATTILRLLKDQTLAATLGMAGRVLAEECFDEEEVFDRVRTEYVRLLVDKGLIVDRSDG